jgi:hypothetical protein
MHVTLKGVGHGEKSRTCDLRIWWRGSSARKKGNAGREDQRSRSLLLQNATFFDFQRKSGKNQEKVVDMRGKADGF